MPSSHEIDFKARCPRSLTPSGARVRTHLPEPPSTMFSSTYLARVKVRVRLRVRVRVRVRARVPNPKPQPEPEPEPEPEP